MNAIQTLALIIIAIIATACGQRELLSTDVDPQLAPYGAQILSWVGASKWDSSMAEVKLVDSIPGDALIMGVCVRPELGVFLPHSRKIHIKREAWNNINDAGRLYLLAHEMCHCLYNAGHTNEEDKFMSPTHVYGGEDVLELANDFRACKAAFKK